MTRIQESRIQESEKGFTLIETALALTVLLGGVLAGAHLLSYAVATSHRAGVRAQAAVLLALKAEEIQASRTAPAAGGTEYLRATSDGLWDTVREAGEATHLRVWRIVSSQPVRAEIDVYAVDGAARRLAHATVTWP